MLFREIFLKKMAYILKTSTVEHRLQKPVPYRLATPQKNDDTMLIVLIFPYTRIILQALLSHIIPKTQVLLLPNEI